MHINKTIRSFATITGLALSLPLYANSDFGQGLGPHDSTQQSNNCQLEPSTDSTITPEVESQLQFMGEEEKLARDVYVYLNSLWNHNVFVNIAKAEQAHIDSVTKFLDAYNIPNLAAAEYGVFTNPNLQSLYDSLIAKGSSSLIDALMVGALIEEVDISDLLVSIGQISDQAIVQMYTNLLNGSYSHLRAFVSQLELQGVTYSSQGYLSQQQVDDILNSSNSHAAIDSAQSMTANGALISSDSCFSYTMLSNSEYVVNGHHFTSDDNAQFSSKIRVNAQELGQNAKLLAVVGYTSDSEHSTLLMRDSGSWVVWDGNTNSLTYAEQIILKSEQNFEIFTGNLDVKSGNYSLSVGYILDNGSIVYSAEPLYFSVQE
ncbi:MAG: DUF2202 domain-containing protein [Pseudomonadota bacterium]